MAAGRVRIRRSTTLPLTVLLGKLLASAADCAGAEHLSLLQVQAQPELRAKEPAKLRPRGAPEALSPRVRKDHLQWTVAQGPFAPLPADFELAALSQGRQSPGGGEGGLRNTSPEAVEILRANSPRFINTFLCLIVGAIAAATAVGCCMGERWWVGAMVVSSYAVLVPGLFSMDFSFNIAAVTPSVPPLVPSMRVQITAPRGVSGPIRESTRSVVPLLWDTGSRQGAVLIAVFAFVVPIAKLVLLALAESWRSKDGLRLQVARWSVLLVQIISKWASPDMFAFMLLYYLLRTLNHPPLIESLQVLDIGFSCYNVFCVASVVSTLAVHLPPPADQKAASARRSPGPLRQWVVPITALLFAVWAGVFVTGLLAPCLYMRLDQDILMRATGLPSAVAPLIESLGIADMVNSDVSIWRAASAMWGWFFDSHELNLLLSAVMLSVFSVALTVLDMLVLLLAAVCARCGDTQEDVGEKALEGMEWRQRAGAAMQVSYVLKHLSMLDVCATGVVVISFAASIYAEQGIIIGMMWGIYVVIASEFVHYLAYYFVLWTTESVCAGRNA